MEESRETQPFSTIPSLQSTEFSTTTVIPQSTIMPSGNTEEPLTTTSISLFSSTLGAISEIIKDNTGELTTKITKAITTTTSKISESMSAVEIKTTTASSIASSTLISEAVAKTSAATTTTTATAIVTNKLSVNDLSSSLQLFGWADYLVFVLMLIVCSLIGIYFGFVEKRKQLRGKNGEIRVIEERRGSEALDYLVGGRKMQVFPVAMSLVASFISGISLLGTSTEIYVYGTQYAFLLITIVFAGAISWYIFLPVFCNLQLTSTYEYLELRFNKSIRLFGSVLFTIAVIFWLPIVIFVPALAFNQVTGINIHIITPIVCVVCIFYTCVGGLKAVVWTDVVQSFIMFGSIIVVIVKGTIGVGGLGEVIHRNYESGRIEAPTFNLDPTIRMTVWSVFIGGTLFWTQSIVCNQVMMQRFLALPSLKAVKRSLCIFVIGLLFMYSCTFYNGMLIFAKYHKCDPLTTKLAKAKDQLVPLLVMDVLSELPGLPGLFVAGVFSAALSSLSTGLNSLSAVFLEDFLKPNIKQELSERQTGIFLKSVVVVLGIISILLVFVVEQLGMVLQLSITLSSVVNGPLFGIFLMGVCMPWITSRSALTGGLLSLTIMTYICVKAQIDIATGQLNFPTKPTSVEDCFYEFASNNTIKSPSPALETHEQNLNPFAQLHHMSFLWYVAFGALSAIICGNISILIFGRTHPDEYDTSLMSPPIRKYFKCKKCSDDMDESKEVETVLMSDVCVKNFDNKI